MSGDPLSAWHQFSSDFGRLAKNINRSTSVNINSAQLRDQVKIVARQYFHDARPLLLREGFDVSNLDHSLQRLHQLAEGQNAATSYKRCIKAVRKVLPGLTSRLEMQTASSEVGTPANVMEVQLAEAIAALVPTAALSYQQAILDLAEATRLSFRGTATELREVLREVLDHQAPDEDVMGAPGFKLEKDRSKPTMKQKVRFILKARDQGETTRASPERSVEAVEAIVGGLTRSVYDYGSLVTHVAGERQSVVHLKRYVDAVLAHLLEL